MDRRILLYKLIALIWKWEDLFSIKKFREINMNRLVQSTVNIIW